LEHEDAPAGSAVLSSGVVVGVDGTLLSITVVVSKKLGFALIPLDRGGVPDLSVIGDKSDSAGVEPYDLTTTSKAEVPMQSLNQLPMVTDRVEARSA
jgi:hypothetical protein